MLATNLTIEQDKSSSGARLWQWAASSGFSPSSGLPFHSWDGASMTLSQWGRAARWTTPKETGTVQNIIRLMFLWTEWMNYHLPLPFALIHKSFFSLDRDYITYMLTLTVLYLAFPAITMFSCYDSIYKHFKKIHHHRVNMMKTCGSQVVDGVKGLKRSTLPKFVSTSEKMLLKIASKKIFQCKNVCIFRCFNILYKKNHRSFFSCVYNCCLTNTHDCLNMKKYFSACIFTSITSHI